MFYLITILILSLNSILCKELNQTILFETYGYSVDSVSVDLHGKSINSIAKLTFHEYTNLKVLHLDDNKLRSVDNFTFKDLYQLEELSLESNNIVQINSNAFVGLNNLKLLCFFDNPITLLYPDQLSKLCKSCVVKTNEKCIKNISLPNKVSQGKNCYDLYKNGFKNNGVYEIFPENENDSIRVYCEMFKGGWTRVMNKIDNSKTAFNKSWLEYTNGFGSDLNSNNWLGLNYLRQITNQQLMSLRIELSNNEDDSYMIEYDQFLIGPSSQKFKLTLGNKKFGTLTDYFTASSNGMKFSTYDQDNDIYPGSCSKQYNGGWWFASCYSVCLTCENNEGGQWALDINTPEWQYSKTIKMLIKPYFQS